MSTFSILRTVPSKALLSSGIVVLFSGCSTPQQALDQANHTTKLMSQLEIQLEQFQSVMTVAQKSRLDSIANQRQVLERQQMSARLEDIAMKSAGDTTEGPMREKLLTAADFIGGIDSSLAKSREADATRLRGLLAPLPSTAASMNAAQVATANMGTELPLKVRLDELAAAAKDIKGSVKDDLDKLKQAKAKAAVASAQAADAAASEAEVTKPSN
jgi:hypothetical protein